MKEGIRTTTIRQAGKKDVQVTVSGIHSNTKNQAVFRYLAAHGKVNLKEKVVYHVYLGVPGSSSMGTEVMLCYQSLWVATI